MNKIKIAIVGVGNCASSLIQGIHYYREKTLQDAIGLMHWEIGGYKPGDIDVVAAFDTDKRKVGVDVHEAVFRLPTARLFSVPTFPNQASLYGWAGLWTASRPYEGLRTQPYLCSD